MTVRRPRPPRHRPLLTVPVRHHQVHLYVRADRLTGRYEVDPGFVATPEGGLERRHDSAFVVGRRAAIRALQHHANRHNDTDPLPGRLHIGPIAPIGIARRTSLGEWIYPHDPELVRFRNGTWTLTCPALVGPEGEWQTWWDYGYRNRRAALANFQAATHRRRRRHGRRTPTGAYATAHGRATDH